MDFLKSFLGFLMGMLVTLFIFDDISNKRQRETFKWQADYGIKMQVLRDFELNSKKYSSVAYDAIKDISYQKDRDTSSIIQKWEDDVNDNLETSLESLESWFDRGNHIELGRAIDNFRAKKEMIWNVRYDVYLTNVSTNPNVKLAQEKTWHDFDEQHFLPIRKDYHESSKTILSITKTYLSNK